MTRADHDVLIGVGVDQVVLARFRAALERRGDRMMKRLFTAAEAERCLRLRDPVPELAVRFAAKEATFKAIGTGLRRGVRWRDVEVLNAPSGRPYLNLYGRVLELARAAGGRRTLVSLTHEVDVAAAQVLLLGVPGAAPWADEDRLDPAAPHPQPGARA